MKPHKLYSVGSLRYTLPQLLRLCGWLIWGDLCFVLMQAVLPSMLPVQLRAVGVSNTFIALIVGSLPSALNMIFNPIFSTVSDRFRSRWGRRVPFLFVAAPAMGVLLIGVGFSSKLAAGLVGLLTLAGLSVSAQSCYLGLLAVFVILFSVANVVVGSIYCYLLADVVPQVVIGRFLAVFRMAGQLAGFIWGYWFLSKAETNSELIYISVSVIYTVSFLLMCWKVQEGSYPDVPTIKGDARDLLLISIKGYFKDCFTKPLYLWVFAMTGVYMSLLASVAFMILLGKEGAGFSQESVAHIVGWSSLVAIPIVIIAGVGVDRWNPLRLALGASLIGAVSAILGYFMVESRGGYIAYSLIFASTMAAFQVAQFPIYLMIFPGAKFGQFSSANALVGSMALVVLNLILGPFLDAAPSYKSLLLWQAVGWIVLVVPLIFAYRSYQSQKTVSAAESLIARDIIPQTEPA